MLEFGRRLRGPNWRTAVLAAAAVGVFALALLLARATAPGAPAEPALTSVAARQSALHLPRLSSAAPLPALAAPAKPAVRVRTISTPAQPKPTPPEPRPKPRTTTTVTIVGSG